MRRRRRIRHQPDDLRAAFCGYLLNSAGVMSPQVIQYKDVAAADGRAQHPPHVDVEDIRVYDTFDSVDRLRPRNPQRTDDLGVRAVDARHPL